VLSSFRHQRAKDQPAVGFCPAAAHSLSISTPATYTGDLLELSRLS
jgi:hypothetical protein